jgi:hypothetical protein
LHAGAGIEVESLPAARAFRIVVSTGKPSGIAKFMEKAHGDFISIPKFRVYLFLSFSTLEHDDSDY